MFWSGCPWDDPGIVPGTDRICPWDKPSLSKGKTQVFSSFYTVEAQFDKPSLSQGQTQLVPGTIPGTKGGRKHLCVKNLFAFSAR